MMPDEKSRLSAMRKAGRSYKPFYAELKQMVLDEMAEHGIDWYNDDDEDEE